LLKRNVVIVVVRRVYSATESADRESLTSGPDTPTSDDDDGKLVTGKKKKDGAGEEGGNGGENKALKGAKNFGNFLFSAVNKAGKTMTEAGHKLKETVEKNTLLGEFNKEQETFLKEKMEAGTGTGTGPGGVQPPWAGSTDEETLKEQIVSLSQDRRNFVRAPPAGVDFQFTLESMLPVAEAILKVDPDLGKMRYELVPKM
jgi:hypothetical protein